jgi:L-arabinose isomerase
MADITHVRKKAKVGLMVCGHKEYWPQFSGMYEVTLKSAAAFAKYIEVTGVELVTFTNSRGDQMVASPEDSFAAGTYFKSKDIDLLFVYLTSYVASGRFVQGVLQCCCPVVVTSSQLPMDVTSVTTRYTTQSGSACPLSEAYSALERCGKKPVDLLFGYIEEDKYYQRQVEEWCRVANALRAYKGAIFGHLGHSYEGMLDMNFDPTTFTRTFGIHIRMLEMCELAEHVENSTQAEVKAVDDRIRETFELLDPSYDKITQPIKPEDIEWAARCTAGLFKLFNNNNLDGMAYYYEGRNNLYERVASNLIIGNSLLTSEGRSLAGESDMKTAVAMYTTSALGCGGSFAEMNQTHYKENIQMVGHDGPHDIRISAGKPTIRNLGLYHGKRGHGVSVEFSLRHGPITMVGLGSDVNSHFSFIVSEGESQEGPVAQSGNTQTRGYFGEELISRYDERWLKSGVCHHMSLCIGHNASLIEKLCRCIDVTYVRVQ